MNSKLLSKVKEQGIVNIIVGYKNDMEKYDKIIKDIELIRHIFFKKSNINMYDYVQRPDETMSQFFGRIDYDTTLDIYPNIVNGIESLFYNIDQGKNFNKIIKNLGEKCGRKHREDQGKNFNKIIKNLEEKCGRKHREENTDKQIRYFYGEYILTLLKFHTELPKYFIDMYVKGFSSKLKEDFELELSDGVFEGTDSESDNVCQEHKESLEKYLIITGDCKKDLLNIMNVMKYLFKECAINCIELDRFHRQELDEETKKEYLNNISFNDNILDMHIKELKKLFEYPDDPDDNIYTQIYDKFFVRFSCLHRI